MIRVHDLVAPLADALRGSDLGRAEARRALFMAKVVAPAAGLLEQFYSQLAGGDLEQALAGRAWSLDLAVDNYRSLPEGAIERAVRAATQVLGSLDADVYLIPGLFIANAATMAWQGRPVVLLCLEQSRGADDLVVCMAHELSHVLLAAAQTGPPNVALAMYSEGLATAASLVALETARGGARTGEADLAAALWYSDDVLSWCRRHEQELWRLVHPRLGSRECEDLHYVFAKFTADHWRPDGVPYRFGYYLGYTALAGVVTESGLTWAHRLSESEQELTIARTASVGAPL